jgi:hypothetical protein
MAQVMAIIPYEMESVGNRNQSIALPKLNYGEVTNANNTTRLYGTSNARYIGPLSQVGFTDVSDPYHRYKWGDESQFGEVLVKHFLKRMFLKGLGFFKADLTNNNELILDKEATNEVNEFIRMNKIIPFFKKMGKYLLIHGWGVLFPYLYKYTPSTVPGLGASNGMDGFYGGINQDSRWEKVPKGDGYEIDMSLRAVYSEHDIPLQYIKRANIGDIPQLEKLFGETYDIYLNRIISYQVLKEPLIGLYRDQRDRENLKYKSSANESVSNLYKEQRTYMFNEALHFTYEEFNSGLGSSIFKSNIMDKMIKIEEQSDNNHRRQTPFVIINGDPDWSNEDEAAFMNRFNHIWHYSDFMIIYPHIAHKEGGEEYSMDFPSIKVEDMIQSSPSRASQGGAGVFSDLSSDWASICTATGYSIRHLTGNPGGALSAASEDTYNDRLNDVIRFGGLIEGMIRPFLIFCQANGLLSESLELDTLIIKSWLEIKLDEMDKRSQEISKNLTGEKEDDDGEKKDFDEDEDPEKDEKEKDTPDEDEDQDPKKEKEKDEKKNAAENSVEFIKDMLNNIYKRVQEQGAMIEQLKEAESHKELDKVQVSTKIVEEQEMEYSFANLMMLSDIFGELVTNQFEDYVPPRDPSKPLKTRRDLSELNWVPVNSASGNVIEAALDVSFTPDTRPDILVKFKNGVTYRYTGASIYYTRGMNPVDVFNKIVSEGGSAVWEFLRAPISKRSLFHAMKDADPTGYGKGKYRHPAGKALTTGRKTPWAGTPHDTDYSIAANQSVFSTFTLGRKMDLKKNEIPDEIKQNDITFLYSSKNQARINMSIGQAKLQSWDRDKVNVERTNLIPNAVYLNRDQVAKYLPSFNGQLEDYWFALVNSFSAINPFYYAYNGRIRAEYQCATDIKNQVGKNVPLGIYHNLREPEGPNSVYLPEEQIVGMYFVIGYDEKANEDVALIAVEKSAVKTYFDLTKEEDWITPEFNEGRVPPLSNAYPAQVKFNKTYEVYIQTEIDLKSVSFVKVPNCSAEFCTGDLIKMNQALKEIDLKLIDMFRNEDSTYSIPEILEKTNKAVIEIQNAGELRHCILSEMELLKEQNPTLDVSQLLIEAKNSCGKKKVENVK